MKGLSVERAVVQAVMAGAVGTEGEHGDAVLLLMVTPMLPHTILVAEDHPTSLQATVIVVLVEEVAAGMTRVVGRIPVMVQHISHTL